MSGKITQYRYLKLSEPSSGAWPSPEAQRLQPGTIIRIPIADPVPSGPCVFNEETKGWACAHWLETSNPALKRKTGDPEPCTHGSYYETHDGMRHCLTCDHVETKPSDR